ncbi:MAG: hypothetical protein ORN49_05850, partial [Rhodobacteraceae bacterium]|nr:hypothetical protein [Paracoccaceae bacterium]
QAGTSGWPVPAQLWLAQAGSEGGEGGEAGAVAPAADDTVELLTRLTKIEAHILTGLDLMAAGDKAGAEAQLATPKAELYETIEAALLAHKAPAFEDRLEALTTVAKSAVKPEDLAVAHQAVQEGIEAARVAIAPSAADELAAVLALTRESAEDFTAGVKDGKIAELGEYQDARAYLLAARPVLTRLAGSDDAKVKQAADSSAAALDEVIAAMPEVVPTGEIAADEGLILSAAAKVELASYQVK